MSEYSIGNISRNDNKLHITKMFILCTLLEIATKMIFHIGTNIIKLLSLLYRCILIP